MATILQERKWGRARESEEKIGQHGVAMKLDVKNEERGLSFKGGRGKRDPPCMLYKCHSKRGAHSRGAHHERGGTDFRRGIK
jgi:hypothetical protein